MFVRSLFAAFVIVVVGPISLPILVAPAGAQQDPEAWRKLSLLEIRKGFQTKLARQESANEAVAVPPADTFSIVSYPSPAGKMAAYLTPDPKDGKKHPAIVWITGGDCNTIGDVWTPAKPENDQTAAQFRKAGIVMMFPSLRGGNKNPGVKEGFFGEVNDVIAAGEFLAKQPYVDPQRIYLGGHSTGGTLVLLVAASTKQFRGVFSFGPVHVVAGYPQQFLPFDMTRREEIIVRSPIVWLHAVRVPTIVIEGAAGNIEALEAMRKESKNKLLQFVNVPRMDHFNILAPANTVLARKVLDDKGATSAITLTAAEIAEAVAR